MARSDLFISEISVNHVIVCLLLASVGIQFVDLSSVDVRKDLFIN